MQEVYENDPVKQEQLNELRAIAKDLGLVFHHRAGIKKMQQLIADHKNPAKNSAETVASDAQVAKAMDIPEFMTEEEFQRRFPTDPRKEANKLVRCRVRCRNDLKKEWSGEIFSAGSAKLGTFKKFVPFNNEVYHIPQIILDYLREKKCTTFVTVKGIRGLESRKAELMDEFLIEELPPLTLGEVKELAQRQAMADGHQQVG